MPPIPARIIVRYADPPKWPTGYPIRGGYVETFWTPVLGPGALALARRLAYRLDSAAGVAQRRGNGDRDVSRGIEVVPELLAAEVGIRGKRAVDHPGAQRLGQLVRFGFASVPVEGEYLLEPRWPLLSMEQAERIPPTLGKFARPPERQIIGVPAEQSA